MGTLNKNILPALAMIYNSTIIARKMHHMFFYMFSSVFEGNGWHCSILFLSVFGAELTKQDINRKSFSYFFLRT